jgi:beta-xylosidase
MKNSLLLLAACLVIAAGCTASPKEQVAVNPLTYTDIPDPDIIRIGEDYYMVSTTMYFCPGAPIMHSRDLVHWEIVSYIYDVIEDDDIYNLRNGRNAYGKGQWATTLRYHDGTYYALFVSNDQQKTYMYRTKDIVNGPWERNVIEGYFMHDASLLFDDGRLWVVWGNGNLNLAELEPDGSAVKAGTEAELLIESPREGWNLRAEGAHF